MDSMRCNACAQDATLLLRVVPHSVTRVLWDSAPRYISACSRHIEDAKKIGKVMAVTPLSDEVVTRIVQ